MKKYITVRRFFVAAALLTGSLSFSSCENDNEGPSGEYAQDAVLVSNEGNFNSSNASVSYLNRSNGSVTNEIFKKANPEMVLGDVLQSMAVHGDRAFMVMNNSRKVVVANANTFKAEGEISGLEMPRYFVALNDSKGYVTEWVTFSGNGRVAVVDLKTLTVTKIIEVGINPERLLLAGGKLYVANREDNKLSVINTATDVLETTIPVTHGPNGLALDNNNNLWVTSSGLKVYDPVTWEISTETSAPGTLSKINTSSNTVVDTANFSSRSASPGNLTTSKDKTRLYFTYNGKTYQQDPQVRQLSRTPFIGRSFNALGVDPATNYLYAARSTGYTSDGWVIRFNPSGAAVDSFRVGIAPNGFVFR
ncbi:DUF5074 domain-containing protein [Pontibacter ruber]|uniref:DUF5074 domain-containing protein n=1 Tax=Pontibacter ruber TaxID=1343895 RepID=A0ABW5CVY4_9BACT|nr:DUF5074 domain-containing protein [Pontibacter ruber]